MDLPPPFHRVLPVGDLLFHEGLYPMEVGWEDIRPGQAYPNRDHPAYYYFKWADGRVLPSFTLALVLEGAGEFRTRRGGRRIVAGDCFLILPGEWHRHRPESETGWKLAWVEFDGTLPFGWWRSGAFGDTPDFPVVADLALFAAQFARLLREVHVAPMKNTGSLARQVVGLLSHIVREPEEKSRAGETGDAAVDLALDCIRNYSHGILDVPAVVRHAGVGRRTLEMRFRAALDRGILDEIQRQRFARAARLLEETDLPVKRIADRSGFGSHERLRIVFNRLAGCSPDDYRKRKRADRRE